MPNEECELCGKTTNFIIFTTIEANSHYKITLKLCYYCNWFIERKKFIKKRRQLKKAIKTEVQ